MAVILGMEGAGFAYHPSHPVFQDITLGIQAGEVLSILGCNGAGKSTLVKCLLHLLPLSQGTVRLAGQDVKTMSPTRMAGLIGYVPQAHQSVFPFSVVEFVLMGRAPHIPVFRSPTQKDYRIALQALEKIDLARLAKKNISEISGGERQMVLIARALTQTPRILVFDEPTSHLDLANQLKVLSVIDLLSREGLGIIMTSHFPDHGFLLTQRTAIMQEGRIVAEGKAEEVITSSHLRTAYGIDVDVCYVEQAGRRVCIPRREALIGLEGAKTGLEKNRDSGTDR